MVLCHREKDILSSIQPSCSTVNLHVSLVLLMTGGDSSPSPALVLAVMLHSYTVNGRRSSKVVERTFPPNFRENCSGTIWSS